MSKVMECLADFFGNDDFSVVATEECGNVLKTWCKDSVGDDCYVNLLITPNRVRVFSYSV